MNIVLAKKQTKLGTLKWARK